MPGLGCLFIVFSLSLSFLSFLGRFSFLTFPFFLFIVGFYLCWTLGSGHYSIFVVGSVGLLFGIFRCSVRKRGFHNASMYSMFAKVRISPKRTIRIKRVGTFLSSVWRVLNFTLETFIDQKDDVLSFGIQDLYFLSRDIDI